MTITEYANEVVVSVKVVIEKAQEFGFQVFEEEDILEQEAISMLDDYFEEYIPPKKIVKCINAYVEGLTEGKEYEVLKEYIIFGDTKYVVENDYGKKIDYNALRFSDIEYAKSNENDKKTLKDKIPQGVNEESEEEIITNASSMTVLNFVVSIKKPILKVEEVIEVARNTFKWFNINSEHDVLYKDEIEVLYEYFKRTPTQINNISNYDDFHYRRLYEKNSGIFNFIEGDNLLRILLKIVLYKYDLVKDAKKHKLKGHTKECYIVMIDYLDKLIEEHNKFLRLFATVMTLKPYEIRSDHLANIMYLNEMVESFKKGITLFMNSYVYNSSDEIYNINYDINDESELPIIKYLAYITEYELPLINGIDGILKRVKELEQEGALPVTKLRDHFSRN